MTSTPAVQAEPLQGTPKVPARRWSISVAIILISALPALAFVVYTKSRPPSEGWPQASSWRAPDNNDNTKVSDALLRQYEEQQKSLAANLKMQGLVLVFALVLLHVRLAGVEIKGLGLTIPARAAQAFLPAVLLYLWLGFGYTLNEAIDSRIVLHKLLASSTSLPGVSERVLRDRFFVDVYFFRFHHEISGYKEYGGTLVFGFLGCFALFCGLGHGTMLASIANVCGLRKQGREAHCMALAYALLIAAFLFGSHAVFRTSQGDVSWWLQFAILALCVPATAILCRTARQ